MKINPDTKQRYVDFGLENAPEFNRLVAHLGGSKDAAGMLGRSTLPEIPGGMLRPETLYALRHLSVSKHAQTMRGSERKQAAAGQRVEALTSRVLNLGKQVEEALSVLRQHELNL